MVLGYEDHTQCSTNPVGVSQYRTTEQLWGWIILPCVLRVPALNLRNLFSVSPLISSLSWQIGVEGVIDAEKTIWQCDVSADTVLEGRSGIVSRNMKLSLGIRFINDYLYSVTRLTRITKFRISLSVLTLFEGTPHIF